MTDTSPKFAVTSLPKRPIPRDAYYDRRHLIGGQDVLREPVSRSEIAERAHEYGIAVDDVQANFPVPVVGSGRSSRKKADIAIFAPGHDHVLDNLQRVVICPPEPTVGKAVVKSSGSTVTSCTRSPTCARGHLTLPRHRRPPRTTAGDTTRIDNPPATAATRRIDPRPATRPRPAAGSWSPNSA
jgi:hypothetical protein